MSVIENILALNLTPTLMFMVGVGLSVKTNILALKLKLTKRIRLSVKETNTVTPKLTLMLHGG